MGKFSRRNLLALQLVWGAAGIAVFPVVAHATAENDRKYALETIGALRAWDNVDGLFGDYVTDAYKDYFAHQSRFRSVDFSKVDAALTHSKIPYTKAIEDPEILGQLSRSLKAQSLIRTRIQKEGPEYRFTLDWLHSPGMDLLSTETFTLTEPGTRNGGSDGSSGAGFPGLGNIKGSLAMALGNLFSKVPFGGQVTGRDENSVTVNMGAQASLKKGDTLVIATLDEVKKHPLLKSIVDWRLTPTGKVVVESVDDGIAFCRVSEEEEGRQIARYQKITQIIPKPVESPNPAGGPLEPTNPLEEPPHLGFIQGSLWSGFFSRQFSSQNGLIGKTGGGFLYGARGTGEIWFNREFFSNLELGYGTFGYSQSDIATNLPTAAQGVSGSVFTLKFDVGYSYLITGDFFGPKGWVKAGYLVTSYTLPISSDEATSPFSVKSAFIGLGGDLPIRGGFGARLDLAFGFFNSGSETGSPNGPIGSSSNAQIYLGGYYHYKPRITFQAGFELHGSAADYSNASNSLSQKTFTFLPSVLYYF